MLYRNSVHRDRWIDIVDSIWKMGNIWLLKPLYLARVISSKRGDIFRRTVANSFSRLSVDASICYRDIAFVQPWTSGRACKDLWSLHVCVRQFFPSPGFLSTIVSHRRVRVLTRIKWETVRHRALYSVRHGRWRATGKNIPRAERLWVSRVTRVSRLLCSLPISLSADYRQTWRCPSRVSPGARHGNRPIKWILSRSRPPMRNTAAIKVGTAIVGMVEFPLCVPSAFVRTAKADRSRKIYYPLALYPANEPNHPSVSITGTPTYFQESSVHVPSCEKLHRTYTYGIECALAQPRAAVNANQARFDIRLYSIAQYSTHLQHDADPLKIHRTSYQLCRVIFYAVNH